MRPHRYILAACVLVAVALVPAGAQAFYILSPKSEGCHERLTLGALGADSEPFGSANPASAKLLDLFAARARAVGVPDDEATRAFVDEVSDRYGFADRLLAERFVLASFVAGVRQPDTDGLSVIKFNETRSVHLQDGNQPRHALRQTGHDYETGDLEATGRARQLIRERLDSALESWASEETAVTETRWSFSFYGEVDIGILAAAFELGRAAHIIQDSYAHALRDEEMQVVAVSNFVDAVEQRYYEPRDGPGHSDRLDECDAEASAFDELRVVAARDETDALFAAATPAFADPSDAQRLDKLAEPVLDRVFALRDGCTYANDYCDNAWLPLAESDLTEPYKLSLCATNGQPDAESPGGYLVAIAASIYGLWRIFRSRSGRSIA